MGMAEKLRGARGGGGRPSRRFVGALPALLIAVGLVFDILTPPPFTAVPLFVAAPLAAAPFFSRAGTVRIGVASLLSILVLRSQSGALLQVVPSLEVLTVFTASALALFINGVVRRGSEQLASARVIAETAMRAVLPKPNDWIGGLHVAARYEAAQADEFVGGDLFAVVDTPHGVRLVVGDVRGKGLDAVEAVAVIIGAFREVAEHEASLEGVAQRLERALAREGERRGGIDPVEGFVTAVLAEIPHGAAEVRIVNRGHPEPLLLHPDGGGGAGAERARAAARHGSGGVAGPGRRLESGRRGHAARLHRRSFRGARQAWGVLRPGGPAARADLPRARGAAVRADR